MNEKQQGNPPTEFEPKNKISRRDFLKLSGRALGVLGLKALGVDRIPFAEAAKSPEMQSLSRKEHFKPFNSGNAEWQYVEFQYKNDQREQIGITVSMSELTDPATGLKTQQLLVMRHNLNTKETQKILTTEPVHLTNLPQLILLKMRVVISLQNFLTTKQMIVTQ